MRAILVCVDYADLLAVTLPHNRHHFEEVCVVTSPGDTETMMVCEANRASCFVTDTFYRGGAVFNKWAALEEGLDWFGRCGWLCVMDADVLWPCNLTPFGANYFIPQVGTLYTPLRRMAPWPLPPGQSLPPEDTWRNYSVHRNVAEWAGYSQIFHAEDPHLGPAPWHQTNWVHAGGADSMFQRKWPATHKVRPPFEVLHLGPAGVNWCGRASTYGDGTEPADGQIRASLVRAYVRERAGKSGEDRFRHEKL